VKRLLIVEDSPVLRLTLVAACEDAGFAVIEAWDGRDALVKVGMHHPDLILCDLMMPTMNGVDFLAHVQAHPDHGRIPVIIMTRYHEAAAALPPSIPVLIKPFQLAELLAMVHEQLSH